jgi:hypothetical protein
VKYYVPNIAKSKCKSINIDGISKNNYIIIGILVNAYKIINLIAIALKTKLSAN